MRLNVTFYVHCLSCLFYYYISQFLYVTHFPFLPLNLCTRICGRARARARARTHTHTHTHTHTCPFLLLSIPIYTVCSPVLFFCTSRCIPFGFCLSQTHIWRTVSGRRSLLVIRFEGHYMYINNFNLTYDQQISKFFPIYVNWRLNIFTRCNHTTVSWASRI